ncbi:MAG: hypothetical protein HWE16_15615 [Gammaproteobacteria bacterium]|nr:hypothetical protein [Gammaproteobacteria bacterium]
MMTDLLLILVPLAIMGVSLYVFVRGYKYAKANDQGYTILSALDNPVADEIETPAEIEAKRLIMEYAEAMNGRYSDVHKANHTMQWVRRLDEHVQKNQAYYQAEVEADMPVEQLADSNSNVTSIFSKRR